MSKEVTLVSKEVLMEAQDFSTQNQIILSLLRGGGSINRIEAYRLGITALNSRISDLRNRQGITGIVGKFEAGSKCKRYSLNPENSQAA